MRGVSVLFFAWSAAGNASQPDDPAALSPTPSPTPPTPAPTPAPPPGPPPPPPPYASGPVTIESQASIGCLTVDGPGQNGNLLQMALCDNTLSSQRWKFEDDQIKLIADPTMCVDVPTSLDEGDKLQLWECIGAANQKWGYDEFAHTIYSGATAQDASLCVALFWDGSTVGVWSCDNANNQEKWFTTKSLPAPSGAFVNAVSNTCLDVPGRNAENGQELWMWECDGSDGQNWQFANGNVQYLTDPSKCVAVNPYSASSEGYRLQIWDCKSTPPLLWNYNYDYRTIVLTSNDAWCMDVKNGDGKTGAVVQVIKCDNQDKQKWQSSQSGIPF